MISWEPNVAPWNAGYIDNFWIKFESGKRNWDSTIERKAGGVDPMKEPDLQQLTFTLSSALPYMRS